MGLLDQNRNLLLELLCESTLIGWFVIESTGEILDLNKTGMEMLGIEGKKTVNIKDYIQHDTLGVFYELLRKVEQKGEKQLCKLSFINQKNSEIYSFIEAIKIDNQHFLITAKDITDVEMLKESEIRYRKLFESSKDGILIIDAHSGKIIDVNKVLTQILDMKEEELIGKAIWEILIFNNVINSEETYHELQNDENLHTYTIENSQGKTIEAEIVSNIYEFGHKKELQCNIRDITERKKQEAELEENRKRLEALISTKDKFFSIASHDLRNPFTIIIGYSELLLQSLEKKDYTQVGDFAKTIHTSSWRVVNLLSNLIEWSRTQIDRIDYNPKYISAVELIHNVLKYTEGPAIHKSITISKGIPEDILVYSDQYMLETVLRNLISNATKFTPKRGNIHIEVLQEPSHVLFSVKDNGVGMDEQTKNHLFKLEKYNSKNGTENEVGSGLGLLICKEFIIKHKGQIWCESEAGKGTTFYFKIPQPVQVNE